MDYTTTLGYFASFLIMVAFLPQAYQVWKTKSVEDVSFLTYAILITGAVAWTAYGSLQNDWPIVVTNVTLFIVQSSIVVCKLKYGKKIIV
jgi:MtN3 and saliva related transmembrane protein